MVGRDEPLLQDKRVQISGSMVKRVAAQQGDKMLSPVITSPFSSRKRYRGDKLVARRLNTQVFIACVIMFSEGYYATQFFPYVATMTQELRGNNDNLGCFTGFVLTAQSAGMLSSASVWANLSNRFGRRRCLLVGLSFSTITTALLSLCTDYWTAVALRLLSGLLNNNLSIVRTSLREAFQTEGQDDTSAFSMLSVAFGASSIVGPSLGGFLYGIEIPGIRDSMQQWTVAFLSCTLLYFICVLASAAILRETSVISLSEGKPVPTALAPEEVSVPLLQKRSFLLLLAMGGGHSYVFTGWELCYPLLARVPRGEDGENWTTSQIGITFMIGSVGLMFYALFLFPKLAKKVPVLKLWLWTWVPPIIIMAVFPQVLGYLLETGWDSRSLPVQVANYISQFVVSVTCGSNFISIQLLLNTYVSREPDGPRLLAVANGHLVSTQALVRALSPITSGFLFTIGLKHSIPYISQSLAFSHLSLIGLVFCFIAAIRFGKEY